MFMNGKASQRARYASTLPASQMSSLHKKKPRKSVLS